MLDFLIINSVVIKKGDNKRLEISPTFKVRRSKDLMIRGRDFYAIWDEERGFWSTNQDDVVDLIDKELSEVKKEKEKTFEGDICVKWMWDSNSGSIDKWHKYVQKQMMDNYHPLDEKILFGDSVVKKEDYATRKLEYVLEPGDISAYNELMEVLYAPEERKKIEWAIGALVCGRSKDIQKFMVFYGGPGTGKSTVLNIIEKLFDGYCATFDAKSLGSSNDAFALEAFKSNPIVAIQHDGDLSKIEDNSRLNSLVSHETLVINEKFKSMYTMRFNTFLIMGTNKPVKITDAKSGITRRLIDVSPTGERIPMRRYNELIKKISFEYGAIASHCLGVFEENPDIYNNYVPLNMIGATNDFYNFMEEMYETYLREESITLKSAWESYKLYCDDAKVLYPLGKRAVKEELKNYFEKYEAHTRNGNNVYSGFKTEKFISTPDEDDIPIVTSGTWLKFDKSKSLLDITLRNMPAQYANDEGNPRYKWVNCKTKLKDLDTKQLHYVKVPENLIVIDFDISGDDGEKSFEKNLEAASAWPKTYAELSKSGKGIHLHYIYAGDVSKLSNKYNEKVEIKVYQGDATLRRRVTKCNDIQIATISSGLPLKGGEKRVLDWEGVKNEKMLRSMISKCLRKEYHGFTTPEVNYICFLFDEAYVNGVKYDLSDMKDSIIKFASSSTNNKEACLRKIQGIHYTSKEEVQPVEFSDDTDILVYDVESFPENKEKGKEALFLVCYKKLGMPFGRRYVTRLFNPSPQEIENLCKHKLVGFNNREYDNHMLYGRLIGKSPAELNDISKRIIEGQKDAKFGPAYNLSYTDVYDFSTKKQSLKKWEIELEGAVHQENHYPWDQAVDVSNWEEIADYCANDVITTEMVFNKCETDWKARQILADLAGGSVNDTTNRLTLKLVFGSDTNPQLVYTDLSTGVSTDGSYHEWNKFEGYEFNRYGIDVERYSLPPSDKHKSIYLGIDPSEGGYVEAKIGYAEHVGLLDIASMHPSSIIALNLFGKYTQNYKALLDARIAIKHKDYDTLRSLFNGKLVKYLTNEKEMEALSTALKLPINSMYGLTSAGFPNPARDPRNEDNIVAKRGALFMIALRREFEKRSWKIIHFKTDSIKIPEMTEEQKNFVIEFGKKYGYEFEYEAMYEKFCLVNESTYIAKYDDKGIRNKGGKKANEWTATGTQFQVPYVFKSLFSKEDICFDDMCESKTTKSSLYLDMNEGLPDVTEAEKVKKLRLTPKEKITKSNAELLERYSMHSDSEIDEMIAAGHNYKFVGRVGSFTPIVKGCGGGILLRDADGKYAAVTGTKGYRWLESSSVRKTYLEDFVDKAYYEELCEKAKEEISKHVNFEDFVEKQVPPFLDIASDELPF